jgi:CubicO group peptidase (beta-lactamase class C family)
MGPDRVVPERILAPGFEAVGRAFEDAVADRPGAGAALCVYIDGVPVVDLWGGETYHKDTLQLVFSATKGVAAMCIALLVEDGKLDVDAPVVSYWPEFGANGKDAITVAQLLSHQAGLATVDHPIPPEAWWDGRAAAALAGQAPLWPPGSMIVYHAISVGTLSDELVRRVDGRSIGQFIAQRLAEPLRAEFWCGLPEQLEARVAPVIARREEEIQPTSVTGAQASLIERISENTPGGAAPVEWFNQPWTHRIELPAGNGICTARGLARLYAACVSDVDETRLLSRPTLEEILTSEVEGRDAFTDQVIRRDGFGFILSCPAHPMAGPASFGHSGAGGAIGFADADRRLGFAFVTDRFPEVPTADPAAKGPILDSVLACL